MRRRTISYNAVSTLRRRGVSTGSQDNLLKYLQFLAYHCLFQIAPNLDLRVENRIFFFLFIFIFTQLFLYLSLSKIDFHSNPSVRFSGTSREDKFHNQWYFSLLLKKHMVMAFSVFHFFHLVVSVDSKRTQGRGRPLLHKNYHCVIMP